MNRISTDRAAFSRSRVLRGGLGERLRRWKRGRQALVPAGLLSRGGRLGAEQFYVGGDRVKHFAVIVSAA